MLRRILPQFSTALVSGLVEPFSGMEEVGRSFAPGRWQLWPAEQAAAVREFLHAWWAHTLTDPDPAVPAYEVLALCAEASATLSSWLQVWEAQTYAVADQHLAEAVAHWEHDLLGDELPWETWNWEDEEETRTELTAWLIRHAPARLRAQNTPEELLHRVRLSASPAPPAGRTRTGPTTATEPPPTANFCTQPPRKSTVLIEGWLRVSLLVFKAPACGGLAVGRSLAALRLVGR